MGHAVSGQAPARAVAGHACRVLSAAILCGAGIALIIVHWDLCLTFRRKVGYWPRLAAPRTYRDKIQWRKIFDRNPFFPKLQDKLISKVIVRALVPDQAMPAVLWEGADAGAMPADLPSPPYVLKGNHGCRFNVMVREADAGAHARLVTDGHRLMRSRWGGDIREWAYGRIAPRLFLEEMLVTSSGLPPVECKITVLHGHPLVITAENRTHAGTTYGYYSDNWSRLPMEVGDGSRSTDIPRPLCLDRMLHAASLIGSLVDMVRVDFYDVDGKACFGECTIYPVSGLLPIRPRRFDIEWGDAWDLRQSWFFRSNLSLPLRVYRWALGTRERQKCVRRNLGRADRAQPVE